MGWIFGFSCDRSLRFGSRGGLSAYQVGPGARASIIARRALAVAGNKGKVALDDGQDLQGRCDALLRDPS